MGQISMSQINKLRNLLSLCRVGCWVLLLCIASTSQAAPTHQARIEPGVIAGIRNGSTLYIECTLPRGDDAKNLLERYLADPKTWETYKGRMAVAIPYTNLNMQSRRKVLEALFPDDYVDEAGWWHSVRFPGEGNIGLWRNLAEWLTGEGNNFTAIRQAPENRDVNDWLEPGVQLLVPRAILPEVMRKPSPRPAPRAVSTASSPIRSAPRGDLEYGRDAEGEHAVYRLKKGEAIYTAVVVQFTDYRENVDIRRACDEILKRSNIQDEHRMQPGQRIIIPLEMLSDQYQPAGSEQRQVYEEVREEQVRQQARQVRTRDLEGVVIILDPGHGGRDHGAAYEPMGLYEDELNYDIAMRIKEILETQTQARVFSTVKDTVQGFNYADVTRFKHDTNEILLTTPPYNNHEASISANLRWYLANYIFNNLLKEGVDERKVLFASIHCDALFNDQLRGAMVYVPGAQYRRDREQPSNPIYDHFAEARAQRAVTTTASERRRDEAMSRNFASTLLRNLAQHDPPIKVHSTGDPIRNVIRQSGGRAYVPAVLRNTKIPTKVLIESANLTNAQDRAALADPQWRQAFAEAFVNALREHFDS